MSRVVMVTSVSGQLGGRFVRLLQSEPGIQRIIGVDVVPPATALGRADFVRADIRNPIIAKVIAQADVDTVVHMGVLAAPPVGGRTSMKEINVIGTMQLLAACQTARSVRALVVKSSSVVYGSSPKNPALFTEDLEPREVPRSGWEKDSVEVEGYVRGFARRRPDVTVSVLRFANFAGPGVDTPLTGYLAGPVVPTPLGFDPRLQFVHEDDGLGVLRRVTLDPRAGAFNVAGPGVVLLSQAIRRAGRLALPTPVRLGSPLTQMLRGAGLSDGAPGGLATLCHGQVLDCTHLRETYGITPRYTSLEAFDDFVRSRRLGGPLSAAAVAAGEDRLRRALRLIGALGG